MGCLIFYFLCVLVTLYAAYLFTFRMYKWDDMDEKFGRQIVLPRIVYLIVFGCAFIPFINIGLVVVFLIFLAAANEDVRIDSWLFKKPEGEATSSND